MLKTILVLSKKPFFQSPDLEELLKTLQQELKLELPSFSFSNIKADRAIKKIEESLVSAVLLYTLKLEGKHGALGETYEIRGLPESKVVTSHHQGLPASHMPGLSFANYLKQVKGIPLIVVLDVHDATRNFLYKLGARRVFESNTPKEYIIKALHEILYPSIK